MGNSWGDGSTIKVNSSKNQEAIVQLDGNIVAGKTSTADIWGEIDGEQYDTTVDTAETNNVISVNLLNKDSYFTGINEFGNEGSKIDLTFANGARWNMTGDSPVSTLAMRNGGIVDLTYGNEPATTSRFRTLTADNLTDEGGIFRVNTDIKNDKTDQIIIGEGAGTHQIEVMPTGTGADREAMDSSLSNSMTATLPSRWPTRTARWSKGCIFTSWRTGRAATDRNGT